MSRDNSAEKDDNVAEPSGNGDDNVFDVEKILDHKIDRGALMLQVRWLGYGPADDTWEPEIDLRESANEVVSVYLAKHDCKSGEELFMKIQKKKKQKTPKKRRHESDDDDESVKSDDGSEDSFNAKKGSTKKQKKSKRQSSQTPSSCKSNKVPTKAALKSYDSTATPIAPNNAKKAAMEIRDQRRTWFEEESSDDEQEGTPTEVEKIANKVKRNEVAPAEVKKDPVVASVGAKTPHSLVVPQSSEQGTSSSSSHSPSKDSKKQNGKSNEQIVNLPKTLMQPAAKVKKEESAWCVQGIVRHVDEMNGARTKLVLMGNSTTGDQRVLEPTEAFALDSWALTKYLLDRCEF